MGTAPAQGFLPDPLYLSEQTVDPDAVAGFGPLYVKSVAGVTQLFFRSAGGGDTVHQITPPSGGGAPVDATYLTLSLNGTLTAERVFTPGTALIAVDGGDGGAYTLSVDATATPTASKIPIALGTGKLAAGWISEVLATTDLTDVTAVTGSGTTIVFNNTPTLLTPTIADFTNAQHDHLDVDDGGTLDAAAITSGVFALARITEVLALANLTDVTAKTGTGTVVVMDTSPTIVTPTIASFVNATHNHQSAAGGGTLDTAAITSGVFPVARGGTSTSSWTAGRVVFAGAGGTSLTEDAALFWDNSTKRLGIGSVGTINADLTISSDTQSLFTISTSVVTAASGNDLLFRRSRGTHASPATVVNGDEIAEFRFTAYNDAYRSAAVMRVEIDGAVAATGADMPGRFVWLTTPDGSATPVRRMTINATGEVTVGNSGPVGVEFAVSQNTAGVDLRTGILGNDAGQTYFAFGDAVTGFSWLWLYWGVNYGSNYLMLYQVASGVSFLYCDPNSGYMIVNQDSYATTPSANLDLQGSLGLRQVATSALATGTYNDFDIITDAADEQTVYRLAHTGAVTFNGFLAPAQDQVRLMIIYNPTAFNATITHENAGSAAANRVHTATAASVVLGTRDSCMLWYDNVDDKWRMLNREL